MTTETPIPAPAAQDSAVRREQFEKAVSGHRLKVAGSAGDKPLLVVGGLLMAGGVVGAFVQYQATLSQDDARDIASSQVLALALLALTVAGAALFAAGFLARVLRLWLLRQLLENRARDELLAPLLDGMSGQRERV